MKCGIIEEKHIDRKKERIMKIIQAVTAFFKNLTKDLFYLLLIILVLIAGINIYVIARAEADIVSPEQAGSGYDCILVPGCGVHGDTPSDMLRDRLDRAIALYEEDAAPVILMSGDHEDDYYNEVAVMQNYAIAHGVPAEAVQLDHEGFSTFESMYRAANEFGMQKVLVVTQRYHLYRAVYVAKHMGMEVTGVQAMPNTYRAQIYNEIREILARDKDFLFCLLHVTPSTE